MAEGSEKQEPQVYVLFAASAGSPNRAGGPPVICFVATMRTLRSKRFACGGAAAGALVSAAVAWPSAQQPPSFRSTVDVVRVEATALDKDRHPVRGLTADDFVVLENGQERPVVAFAPVELPQTPPSPLQTAAWLRDAPRDVVNNDGTDAGRLVVIAFDWSVRYYDQALARRIALAAVDALGPTDQATVLFTRPASTAGTPQGFTGDHARLRAAINQPFAVALTDPHPDRSKRIIDPEGYTSGECLCGLCTLEGLTRLAQTLRTVSQRPKVVLFIGTYVRTFEAMRPTIGPPDTPGQIRPSFSTMAGTTDCPARLRDARRAFDRAMGEANVTVHVLDPVGIDTEASTPLGAGRIRERLDSLPIIADLTGGRTVMNTEAPEKQVASILGESSAYYVVGFTPATLARASSSRRIELRVRRPGVTVKARNLYSLAELPATARQPREVLTSAVTGVLPARSVPLEISAVPIVAGSRVAAVLIGRFGPGTTRPTAMLTAALTPRAVPVTSRRIAIPPPAGGKGSGAAALVSLLLLEPGAYEIRVAAEAPAGAVGSVHTFVDIPDFRRAPLAMSGVLLHVAPEEPAALNEMDDALPFVPTARRTFSPSDTVSALVQVSQGTTRKDALQPVALRMRIIDAREVTERDQSGALNAAEFAGNRTATTRLALPLRALPPGEYLLVLEATLGDRRAERSVRFEVK
jgi:VWFA-related protein